MAGIPFKKNTAATVYLPGLISVADTTIFQVNPTIAAGDFQVSIDGGDLNNLATLPVVSPADSSIVKIVLTAAEMNGDVIVIKAMDAAGTEWCESGVTIYTDTAQTGEIANRIGSFSAVGDNTIFGFIKALLGITTAEPSDIGGTYDSATDSLEAIRNRGDAAWLTATLTAAAVADQVWDEAKSGHTTAGSFGEEEQAHALSTEVADTPQDVWEYTRRGLTSSAKTTINAVSGSDITISRYATFDVEFTGIELTGASVIWFTMKDSKSRADAESRIHIKHIVDSTTTVLYVNGIAATTAQSTLATLTPTASKLRVQIDKELCGTLAKLGSGFYDIKVLYTDDTVTQQADGKGYILDIVTQATS